MLMLLELMSKVPSPDCYRCFINVANVDVEGTFSRPLEKVMLMSPELVTKVPYLDCWRRFC